MVPSNNKRIAKNTILLYLRQLFSMAISLYTVRVVLDVLGAEDYGIYNVTGGLVVLFSFFSTTMSTATQRFLSYEMGMGEKGSPQKIFTLSLYSYFFILLLVLIVAETVGLWFLNNKLIIPSERLFAAQVMFQATTLSFIATVCYTPYSAAIIAMERMDIFAYGGVATSILNLLAVLLLEWLHFSDALIAYAIFLLFNNVLISLYYIHFSRRNFDFCRFKKELFNWRDLKEMISFAFWNMIATICSLLRNQGVNIIINMFFNPVVNAARGVAMQVSSAISNFSYNFYTAVRPQLVKYYSSGNIQKMLDLGCQSSRFSFLLLFVLSAPVFCDADKILGIWLKEVPEYTVLFTRIVLVTSLLEILTVPLDQMIQASGNIKKTFNIVSIINILNIPFSYVLLKAGFGPESTMYLAIILLIIAYIVRIVACRKVIQLDVSSYFIRVDARLIFVLFVYIVWVYVYNSYMSHIHILFSLPIHILLAMFLSMFVGISKNERNYLMNLLIQRLLKLKMKKVD